MIFAYNGQCRSILAVLICLATTAAHGQNAHKEKDLYDGGMSLFNQKKYGAAEAWFRLSIKADPRYRDAWQALADTYRAEGKAAQAEAAQRIAAASPETRDGEPPPLTAEQLQAVNGGVTAPAVAVHSQPSVMKPVAVKPAATVRTVRSAVGANVAAPASFPLAKFPPLKARPGWIIGRAVYEDGRPVPDFHVETAGFNGKFSLNNTANTFFKGEGHNGSYAIRATDNALIVSVRASVTQKFMGQVWTTDLWPTDNLRDGSGQSDFKGRTVPGIVRDFVFRKTGLKPGHKPGDYPGYVVDDNSPVNAYYGAGLYIHCDWGKNGSTDSMTSALSKVYPKGTRVTFQFVPTGPNLDGKTVPAFSRSLPLGMTMYLCDIPSGAYTITAHLTDAAGTTHPLRIATDIPLTADKYKSSAAISWVTGGSDEFLSRIISDRNVYLVE